MNDLTIPQNNQQSLSTGELTEYLQTFGIGKTLTADEKIKFIKICQAFSLNPFKREIHVTKFGGQANIIVGYEVYLKRAERTGKLAGWRTWFESLDPDEDFCCHIEIHRHDWKFPLVHTVYMSEYGNDKSPMWKRMPKMMLRKVAISSGFRMAFPDDLGGMPYEPGEIGEENNILQPVEAVDIKRLNVDSGIIARNKTEEIGESGDKKINGNLPELKENKSDPNYWDHKYRPTTLSPESSKSVLQHILDAVEKCTSIDKLQIYWSAAEAKQLDVDSTITWRNAMVMKANQLGGTLKTT